MQSVDGSDLSFKIVEVLVIIVMPLLYGIATRLPFIYFVIHLESHFNIDWLEIGFYVASYQSARVITSALAIPAPKLSQFLGTAIGLTGYVIVYAFDEDLPVPFVVGTAMVGFSETMSSMQKYAKTMYKSDPKQMLRYQYAFVMIGVMCGFLIGGYVYQNQGIQGASLCGIVVQSTALLAFFTYLYLSDEAEQTMIATEAQSNVEQTAMVTVSKQEDEVSFPVKNTDLSAPGVDDDIEEGALNPKKEHLREDDEDAAVGNNEKVNDVVSEIAVGEKNDEEDEDGDKNAENKDGDEDDYKSTQHHHKHNRDANLESFLVKDDANDHKVRFLSSSEGMDSDLEPFSADEKIDIRKKSVVESNEGDFRQSQVPGKSIVRRTSIFATHRLSALFMRTTIKENYYVSESIPASWMNWLLCISFGVEALTIGYNLSIGPIFMLSEFNQGTGVIGLFFAIGAAAGAVVAIGATCTPFGIKLMSKIAKSPYDLCFAMGGIAIGVFIATVPSFEGHVAGVFLLICFNDLGAMVITELQASVTTISNYSLVGPMGQVIRRSLNVVTALTGPIFFGVFPRLPYLVAGSITLMWTVLLFSAFKYRIDSTTGIISTRTGRSRASVQAKFDSFRGTEAIRGLLKHDKSSL